MTTLDLTRQQVTLEQLLTIAATDSVRIVTTDGRVFMLEEADDFDKEVDSLSASEKFTQFLDERSSEAATTSLDDYRRSLG